MIPHGAETHWHLIQLSVFSIWYPTELKHTLTLNTANTALLASTHSSVAGLRVVIFKARSVTQQSKDRRPGTQWLRRQVIAVRLASLSSSGPASLNLTSLSCLTSLLLTTLLNLFRFPSLCSRVFYTASLCIDLLQPCVCVCARVCVCVCVCVCP